MVKTNPALLIFDTQPEQKEHPEAIAAIKDLAGFFRSHNLPVFFVPAGEVPGTGCLGDIPREADIAVNGERGTALTGTELEKRLWELDVNTVVLAGVSLNGSLERLAVEAFERDFAPVLAGEAILRNGVEGVEDMLRVLEHDYAILPVSNERIKEILG